MRGLYGYIEQQPGSTSTATTASSLSLGARMRKGLKNFCHGDSSTSTGRTDDSLLRRQQNMFVFEDRNAHRKLLRHEEEDEDEDEDEGISFYNGGQTRHRPPSPAVAPTPTLEQMIKQLELEEEMAAVAARKTSAINLSNARRASCVNTSSDRVLRSARNALNQYPPRFSLDGKDSMYRSSFLNIEDDLRRLSSAACRCDGEGKSVHRYNNQRNVVWCRPGVVPKLMGLDAIPIPRERFFGVYGGRAPVMRKRRYGGGGVDRVIRPPEMRKSGDR
ncbi:hypothetical protein LINPERPRIM_LOCUS43949 [Linum perenne]